MQRAALTLRHVDGLSVTDVASLLGRSVHATETLLVRDDVPIFPLYFYAGLALFDTNQWEGIGLQGNLVDQHNVNFIRRKKAVVRRPLSVVQDAQRSSGHEPRTTDH